MSMTFTAEWNKPKLHHIPSDSELATQRAGLSKTKQKKAGIDEKTIEYKKTNNALRLGDAIFLSLFNEPNVRSAIQKAQSSFKHEATINSLLTKMIAASPVIEVDQGTHQAEDAASGGFMLHFDARDVDKKCFHLYVGQEIDGSLKLIEISYMKGSDKVEAHPK